MRKLKFGVCFVLYDLNAKSIELLMKNIECIGTATKSSSSMYASAGMDL